MSGRITIQRRRSLGALPRRSAFITTRREALQAVSQAVCDLRVTVWVPAKLDRTSRGSEVQR